MSAPKHTPVPWVAVGRFVEVADDNVPDICTTDPAAIGQQDLPRSYAECCANARLIAAAPETAAERDRLRAENAELLAALKKLCADCNGDKLGTVKAPRLAVLCAAETALAKATRSAS